MTPHAIQIQGTSLSQSSRPHHNSTFSDLQKCSFLWDIKQTQISFLADNPELGINTSNDIMLPVSEASYDEWAFMPLERKSMLLANMSGRQGPFRTMIKPVTNVGKEQCAGVTRVCTLHTCGSRHSSSMPPNFKELGVLNVDPAPSLLQCFLSPSIIRSVKHLANKTEVIGVSALTAYPLKEGLKFLQDSCNVKPDAINSSSLTAVDSNQNSFSPYIQPEQQSTVNPPASNVMGERNRFCYLAVEYQLGSHILNHSRNSERKLSPYDRRTLLDCKIRGLCKTMENSGRQPGVKTGSVSRSSLVTKMQECSRPGQISGCKQTEPTESPVSTSKPCAAPSRRIGNGNHFFHDPRLQPDKVAALEFRRKLLNSQPVMPRKPRICQRRSLSAADGEVSPDRLKDANTLVEKRNSTADLEVHISDCSIDQDMSQPQNCARHLTMKLSSRMLALQDFFNQQQPLVALWKASCLRALTEGKRWSNADLDWARNKLKVWSCNNGSQPCGSASSCSSSGSIIPSKKGAAPSCSSSGLDEDFGTANPDVLQRTDAYLPYGNVFYKDSEHSLSLRHKEYQSERHGSSLEPLIMSDKITPEAQEVLLVLRDTVALLIDDIVLVDADIAKRNFAPCITMADHLLMIPNMLIALIDHLHYTPQEFELVSVAKNINSLVEDVSNDPIILLFRMIELGHYLYCLGRLLGEKIVPKDLPRLLHSIQVKLQRLKVGRVVRQYFHLPISYDFVVTPYNKDRQLLRLEEECKCLVNLLHPDDPRSMYCPAGYRTIEVLYDEEAGKFETFHHRLNRILSPRRCTARLVSTILRQFNGQELAMTAEHAIDLLSSGHRPRYEDVRALVLTGSRPSREKIFMGT